MPHADVVIYGDAGSNDVGRIEEIFRSFDMRARVEEAAPKGQKISWFVLASVPTRILFEHLAITGTSDGALQLRKLTRRLTEERDTQPSGLLLLQDTETGIQVLLAPGLPEEAYRSLQNLDLAAFTFGPVHYDTSSARWRSVFDEWA